MNSLKDNWKALVTAVLMVVAASVIGSCAGSMNARNHVKVQIPEAVRDPGQPKTITVSEAEADFQVKTEKYKVAMALYATNITDGIERAEAINGLFEWLGASVISAGEMYIPGWSVFGLGTGATFLMGALGIRKPGTFTKADLDAEYDKGRTEERVSIASTKGIVT